MRRKAHRALRANDVQQICRDLEKRGFALRSCNALDVYGGNGEYTLQYYAAKVAGLEIWEIDPRHETSLRARFPDATIRIVDSHQQITETESTFDLIWADNPPVSYGDYVEHFDIFPHVFRIARDSAVLVLNTVLAPPSDIRTYWPTMFDESQLARRRTFYRTDHPEQLSVEEAVAAYREIASEHGFAVEWSVCRSRGVTHYLGLKLARLK
ncbi:MAG TPA: hypothetical protein VF898_10865 [Chloroflexota bacterium]